MGRDAGPAPIAMDAAAPARDGASPARDAGIPEPPPGPVVCGGVECADEELCCTLDLRCFDPGDASACALPPGATEPDACASNADCAPDELCERSDIFAEDDAITVACGGAIGHCVPVREAEACGGFGRGVCGCDGRTYPNPCSASRAGVRVSWNRPCGDPLGEETFACDEGHPTCPDGWHCDFAAGTCVDEHPFVACGTDAQCPEGLTCCEVVGACTPSDCPDCCYVPPPGTSFPCRTDADCDVLPSDMGELFCGGGESCDAPAGCVGRELSCGGELAPVCGCDGVSYANSCWASRDGIRIAHDGECP